MRNAKTKNGKTKSENEEEKALGTRHLALGKSEHQISCFRFPAFPLFAFP
jgi:hypothetical protein